MRSWTSSTAGARNAADALQRQPHLRCRLERAVRGSRRLYRLAKRRNLLLAEHGRNSRDRSRGALRILLPLLDLLNPPFDLHGQSALDSVNNGYRRTRGDRIEVGARADRQNARIGALGGRTQRNRSFRRLGQSLRVPSDAVENPALDGRTIFQWISANGIGHRDIDGALDANAPSRDGVRPGLESQRRVRIDLGDCRRQHRVMVRNALDEPLIRRRGAGRSLPFMANDGGDATSKAQALPAVPDIRVVDLCRPESDA